MKHVPKMSQQKISCNLTVIRVSDLDKALQFYKKLGLPFEQHVHGTGPVHYAATSDTHTFEIYPLLENDLPTTGTRIGFGVESVDSTFAGLLEVGGESVSPPKKSEWGRRASITDPDGHRVELTALVDKEPLRPKFHIYTTCTEEVSPEFDKKLYHIDEYIVSVEDDITGYQDSIRVKSWSFLLEFRIKLAKKKLLKKYDIVTRNSDTPV